MITDAAKALILNSVIDVSIDNIDVISLQNSGGEYFRKEYQSKDTISTKERKYTFYLTENEGNGDIVGLSLYGDGATVTLATGTEMAEQNVEIEKTSTRSLLIYWTVRAVE
jgi:hypothetical protein